MLRKVFPMLLVLALAAGMFLFTGCGGGGGDGDTISPVSPTNPGTDEGSTSGTGTVSGSVSSTSVSSSIRQAIRQAVSTGVAGAEVTAGDYDGTGEFVSFGKTATTDANGDYTLTGLPTGRKNIIIRVKVAKTLDPDEFFEGVVPVIKEGEVAAAPVIDPDTKKQAKIVKFAEKFDATFEVNLGEVLSKIPPSTLKGATDAQIEQIAQAFVNREKAQLQTFRDAGLADDKFVSFREFAFQLQREIHAGIAQGLYSPDAGWKLFDDQLRLRARTLGLSPDVLLALQSVDTTMVGETLPKIVTNTEMQQQIQFKQVIDKLEAMVMALKILTPTFLPQTDYDLIAAGVERVITAFQAAPASMENTLKADPVFGLIQKGVNTIFEKLGLYAGTPRLITKLYPTTVETSQLQTAAGYAPDLSTLTVAAAFRAQTAGTPTPTQLAAFHQELRKLIISKILAALTTLTQEQAAALFVLLIEGPDMGFAYAPNSIPANPGEFAAKIMGVIVAPGGSDLYIDPPAGFPAAPASFGYHLAKVDPASLLNGAAVTANTTPQVYTGVYTASPDPVNKVPPTFKITGVEATTVTVQAMPFVGGPLQKNTAGFWFGMGTPQAAQFVPNPDDAAAVTNAMQNLIGQYVKIEGYILEKRTTGDFGPKTVRVIKIGLASSTFVPAGVQIPTAPSGGTALTNQEGQWSFNKSALQPGEMFQFTWMVSGVATSSFVDFNPQTLVKSPQFRFQNQVSGRDMWESNGHTVTVSGTRSPDGKRLFITSFTDTSTTWPAPGETFVPTGTALTDQVGTWTFNNSQTDPANMFQFSWMEGNTEKKAYVDFDPANLAKTPTFRLKDPTNGRDMWESNGHQVTVSGTLTTTGRLFITKFTDSSTTWPTQPTPTNAEVLRSYAIPGGMGGGLAGADPDFFLFHARVRNTAGQFVLLDTTQFRPDVNLIQVPQALRTQMTTMLTNAGGSTVPVEVTGVWGPDVQDGSYLRRQFIPQTITLFPGPYTQ